MIEEKKLIEFLKDNLKIDFDVSTIDIDDIFKERLVLDVSLLAKGSIISKSSVCKDIDSNITGINSISAWSMANED